MKRGRNCVPILYVVGLSACLATTLFFLFSIEVVLLLNGATAKSDASAPDQLGAIRHPEREKHQSKKQLTLAVSYFLGVQFRPVNFPSTKGKCAEEPKKTTSDDDKCSPTHIAMVVGGYETASRAEVLIKSILHYHQEPVVFHFITDHRSREVIPTLFDTWELPSVSYHIYNIEEFVNRVQWIPNRHYSTVFGLIKLILPEILPEYVDRVLLLDCDVIVLSPLRQFLNHFGRMNGTHIYGLVENLSDWYTAVTPTRRVWPALGRGFNSGVALVNLARVRAIDWRAIWREEANEHLRAKGKTFLADQDVLNAVFKRYPEFVMSLPCAFNLQLGHASMPQSCSSNPETIKIAHWNSQEKLGYRTRYSAFFAQKYGQFEALDGSVFKLREGCQMTGRQIGVGTSAPVTYDDFAEGTDECDAFYRAAAMKHRTLKYSTKYSYETVPNDVTMVTQLSFDRLAIFEKTMAAWRGPVHASIYVTEAELAQVRAFIAGSTTLKGRTNIALHAVFKAGSTYPINYMRNVALNATKTDYVYLADVDFVPSQNLYDNIVEFLKGRDLVNTALVVPAFEMTSRIASSEYPKTKAEMLDVWRAGKAQMFRVDLYPRGHNSTDYNKWKIANSSYMVEWQKGYEPYVILPRSVTPPYAERFVGFGWNKVSHLAALREQGTIFEVLPDAFVIHQSHVPSFDITQFRSSRLYRTCMWKIRESHG